MTTGSQSSQNPTSVVWAMLGVCLMVLMATLDMSIVNVSLPTLVRELNTSFANIQWVIVSYILVITCLMLSVSRLGDMMGKKLIFSTGLVFFTLGSLLCGVSPSAGWLIAFRAIQGVGAAMGQAMGLAIVMEVVPPDKRGRAIGIIGGTVSVGLSLGPSLGGIIIGLFGWRWIFLVNVPLGIVSFYVCRRFIPALKPRETGQRFDVAGALILLVALGCYAMGMIQGQQLGFTSPEVLGLLAGGFVGMAIFLVVESRIRQPMLDLSLFKNGLFSINLLMGVLVFIALATTFILPFYFELVQGRNAQEVGLLMVVVPVSMGALAPIAGSMSDKYGSRGISLLGLIIMIGGCLAISTIQADTPWWGFVLRAAPFGMGLGIFQAPNNTAIMSEAPRERLGVASGLLNYSRTFGQTTGIPLMGTLFTALVMARSSMPEGFDIEAAPRQALVVGVTDTYLLGSGIIFLATLLAVWAFFLDKKRRAEGHAPEGKISWKDRIFKDERKNP